MMPRPKFELEGFLEACRAAIAAADAERAVRELVAEAISNPAAVTAELGEPEHAGLKALYRAAELTVIDFVWAPWQCFKPHNHNMWAVIGLVSGREDNMFWRRVGRTIEACGARSLGAGEAAPLGTDIIHSVTNPIGKWTRAVHVYGGDFFAPVRPRSEWDHESLVEQPWDIEDTRRRFAEAEARFRATSASAAPASSTPGGA
jgi:predicted metal-dependent enzyme (double-stranded beta helix superfamily)